MPATLARAVTHRTLLVLLVLALALLAGCGGDDSETAATATPKATATPDNTDVTKKPTVTVPDELPPDELQIEDIVKGKGPAAKKGDKVYGAVRRADVEHERGVRRVVGPR